MIIRSANYIISAVGPKQYPETGFPEVVFVGRSNVGKSSLLNSLCNRRALARISARPGKTQAINFFELNGEFYFVDVPGYGYAQVSQTQRREWGAFISRYLEEREPLVLIVHLIDLRHPPMKNDIEMSEWLQSLEVPYVVAATKADKISRGKRPLHVAAIRKGLNLDKAIPVVAYSSETGEGRDELWGKINTHICHNCPIDGT